MTQLIKMTQNIFPAYLLRCLALAFLTAWIGGCNVLPVADGQFDHRFYNYGTNDGSFYHFTNVGASAVDTRTGDVFFGGRFTSISNYTCYNIARYDPTFNNWSSLDEQGLQGDQGPSLVVNALAISGKYLYVGGRFTQTYEGTTTNLNNIARYDIDTGEWTALSGSGLNGDVFSLTISGDNLYVGGSFSRTFDSTTTNLNRIASYNTMTNTWSALANNGLDGTPSALLVSGNNLFVGGNFSQ